jgi:long-chain acyl-CoA synthetase
LIAAGVRKGDRVAILSKTRYEWTLLDYAIWSAGAVTVPLYDTSSRAEIEWVLSDSNARAIMVETREHASRIQQVDIALENLTDVWTIEDRAIDVLTSLGVGVTDDELEHRRTAVGPESLATLIYTSGTTGRPKGCMLTHGNFMFEIAVAIQQLHDLFEREDAATLLFLPLPHVFARVIQVGAIRARVRLGHSSDITHLVSDLQSFQPTFVLGVPRVFEQVINAVSQECAIDGRASTFDRAADVAIAYSRAMDTHRPGPFLRARRAMFDRLVYRKVRATFGGKCRYAVSGGAPLGERLGHFYRGMGVTVLEGYGLTETTAAVTANLPDAAKIGTVGRPLGGTTIRVAEDGELLVQGGQVFTGYWRNEEATAEVLPADGWFHTGDLGEIDAEGFLRITGRKDDILVTAGGKNVAPAVLETLVRDHPLVSQCMVVGDGRAYIGALITIDEEALHHWLDQRGRSGDLVDLTNDGDLLGEIQGAIDEANKSVSKAESIRRFVILPDEWTEDAGQLTPSLKLKRNVLTREFKDPIEALYST